MGAKYIPLGVLIKLWQNGEWLGECPQCEGKTNIFSAGGSPLSGSNYTNAVCITCGEFVDQKKSDGLALLLKPALDLCNTYTKKWKILRTRGPVFSWSKGLAGEREPVPDKALEDVVQPVELEVMMKRLK